MPRKLIDVNEAWLERIKSQIPATIDTLRGLEHRILQAQLEGGEDPADLLESVYTQLMDLRRSMETVRIIF